MSKILVVYFSASGTTQTVAQRLAQATNADLAEILPEQPYSAADLNWRDANSRSSVEHATRAARPAMAQPVPSTDGYDVVLLGYPIWWETAPRIIRTWLESQDWDGKTLATFATSGSSIRGADGSRLHDSAPNAHWVPGTRFPADASMEQLRAWAESVTTARP